MQHLKDVNENYFQHMWSALQIAITCAVGGPLLAIAAVVHAIIPFVGANIVSSAIADLHDKLQTRIL